MIKPARKTKCFRIRYSLFTFCLLVILVQVFLGIWLTMLNPIRSQWQAVEPVLELGATVETESTGLPVWMTSFLPEGKRENIVTIDFNRNNATDESVKALTQLPHLQRLYMQRAGVTDGHAKQIAKIKSLRRLALWGTRVSDEGASELLKLPNLEIVDLHQSAITWRTVLKYQEPSTAKLKASYWDGWVTVESRQEIFDLAKLEEKITDIWLKNPNDDDLSFYLKQFSLFKELRLFSVFGENVQVTEKGLQEIFDSEIDLHFNFYGSDQSDKAEMLNTICKIWGARHSQLGIQQNSVQTIYRLSHLEGENKVAYKINQNVDDISILDLDLSQFTALKLYTEFDRFSETVKVMPNLKHLSLRDVSERSLGNYLDTLRKIEGLESFEFWVDSHWSFYKVPWDFFEDWSSVNTLKKVGIYWSGYSSEHIMPILGYPNLSELLVYEKKEYGPRKVVNLLEER